MALMVAAAVGACASKPNIIADYDRSADFSKYRTFDFFADAGPDSTNYQSLFSQYAIAAISREMTARGYTRSDNPDLLINFNAVLQEKTKVTTTPVSTMGGYYGYRGGYYNPWMGYGYGTETNVSQYTEGTFNIDLVDAREKKLVWEAVGIGRVKEKTLANLEQAVSDGVARYFSSYPFVAGEGVPASATR